MSRHAGVSCDNCLASNFRGKRFKCLVCYDYDLCETCHSNEVSTSRHLKSHPMQCILTRNEYGLFFAGEQVTIDSPPSFTCPLCGALGFSDTALQEHVNLGHQDNPAEVVCPICAAMPAGDPNHVTDDFATHLAIEHHSAPRENTEEQNGRQARRMFYPGRGMRSGRPHRGAINMHFGDAPTNAELLANASASNVSSSSAGRDPMDPITELLSQLSGVRNPHLQSVSTATQLQELHTQLQFERQRASILRHQLERVPSKATTNQSGSNTTQGKTFSEALKASGSQQTQSQADDDDPRFLLTRLNENNLTENEEKKVNNDRVEMSFFLKDLLMSLEDLTSDDESQEKVNTTMKHETAPVPVTYVSTTNATQATVALPISAAEKSEQENEISSHASVIPRHISKDGRESDSSEILDADVKRKVQLKRESRDSSHLPVRESSNEARNPNTHLRFSSHGQILLTSEFLTKN